MASADAACRAASIRSGVIVSSDRATTLKTRVIARGQHMLRIDRETKDPVARRPTSGAWSPPSARLAAKLAGVLCSDYSKGVLSDRVLARRLGDRRRFSVVDPKGRDFARYRGADLLTPNEKELMEATRPVDTPERGGTMSSAAAPKHSSGA